MITVSRVAAFICVAILSACHGGSSGETTVVVTPPENPPRPPGPPVDGPAWWSYARDAQHSAVGAIATQSLQQVFWQTRIDLAPQYSGGDLLAHYGSPV